MIQVWILKILFMLILFSKKMFTLFSGGLPIDSFAAEFKESTQQWDNAKRRVWPASKFIIMCLCIKRGPNITYYLILRYPKSRCHIHIKIAKT